MDDNGVVKMVSQTSPYTTIDIVDETFFNGVFGASQVSGCVTESFSPTTTTTTTSSP
jgi:hypothetical protein